MAHTLADRLRQRPGRAYRGIVGRGDGGSHVAAAICCNH
jgi:hypothetical protein